MSDDSTPNPLNLPSYLVPLVPLLYVVLIITLVAILGLVLYFKYIKPSFLSMVYPSITNTLGDVNAANPPGDVNATNYPGDVNSATPQVRPFERLCYFPPGKQIPNVDRSPVFTNRSITHSDVNAAEYPGDVNATISLSDVISAHPQGDTLEASSAQLPATHHSDPFYCFYACVIGCAVPFIICLSTYSTTCALTTYGRELLRLSKMMIEENPLQVLLCACYLEFMWRQYALDPVDPYTIVLVYLATNIRRLCMNHVFVCCFYKLVVRYVMPILHRNDLYRRLIRYAMRFVRRNELDFIFVPESNGTDDAPVHKPKKKIKSIKRPKEDFVISDDGLVFEDFFFDGEEVSGVLMYVTNADVPGLLGSFKNAKLPKDLRRTFSSFSKSWNKNAVDYNHMKMFLFNNLNMVDVTQFARAQHKYQLPEGITHIPDSRLFMPDVAVEHTSPRPPKRGSQEMRPPLLQRTASYDEDTFFYDIFVDPVKSFFMPLHRIKGIIRTMRKQYKTYDDVLAYFNRRMYIPESFEKLDRRKLSWAHPYVNPEWFYFSFDRKDSDRVFNVFAGRLESLRQRFLTFIDRYYELGDMPSHERKTLFKEQSSIFATYMRTPEAQKQFVMGVPKQEICDMIYKKHVLAIEAKAAKSNPMMKIKKKKGKLGCKSVTNARNDKYDQYETSLYHNHEELDQQFYATVYDVKEKQLKLYVSDDESDDEPFVSLPLTEWRERGELIDPDFLESYDPQEYVTLTFTAPPPPPSRVPYYNAKFQDLPIRKKFPFKTESLYSDITVVISTLLFQVVMFAGACLVAKDSLTKTIVSVNDTITNVNDKVTQQIDTIADKTNVVITKFQPTLPQNKLILVEVKTVIHVVYYLYKQDYYSVAAWSSNLLVTRGVEIMDIITSFDYSAGVLPKAKPKLTHKGITYEINPDYLDLVFDSYDPENLDEYERHLNIYGRVSAVEVESAELITSLLCRLLVRLKLADMDDQDIRAANNQFTYINHFSKAVQGDLDILYKITSVVCKLAFGYDPFDAKYNRYVANIVTKIGEISGYKVMGQDIANDPATLRRIITLHHDCMNIMVDPRVEQLTPAVRNLLSKEFTALENIASMANVYLKGVKSRNQPLCVMFTGPPKVGKSAAINFIMPALTRFYHEKYTPDKTYVYGKDEYWEGYSQDRTKFVVCDDALQSLDVADRRRFALDIIGMINTAPYNLMMAFDQKGCLFFDSPYVFISTNAADKGIKNARWNLGISAEEAFTRRLNLVLHKEDQLHDGDNLLEQKFVVHQCTIDPTIVGTTVTVRDIPPLMFRLKRKINSFDTARSYSDDFLDSLYAREITGFSLSIPLTPYAPPGDTQIVETKESDTLEDIELQSLEETIAFAKAYMRSFTKKDADTTVKDYSKVIEDTKDVESQLDIPDDKTYLLKLYKLLGYDTTNLCYVITGISALVAGYALYSIAHTFFKEEGKVYPDDGSGRKHGKHTKSAHADGFWRKIDSTFVRPTFKPQSASDNYIQCLHNRISPSTFLIKASCSNNRQQAVGFHIRDKMVAVPMHFINPIRCGTDQYCQIFVNQQCYDLPWPKDDDLLQVHGEDMVLFLLPDSIPIPKSCYKYIVGLGEYYNSQPMTPYELVSVESSGRPVIKPVTRCDSDPTDCYEAVGELFTIVSPINYCGQTQAGDSGSLVTTIGPQGRPIVVGMHVGKRTNGRDGFGIAIPVTRELFDEAYKLLVPVKVQSDDDPFPMTVLRTVPTAQMHYPPQRTKLRKSPLYNVFGDALKRPAKLYSMPGEPNVLWKAISKMHQTETPVHIFDEERTFRFLMHLYPRCDINGFAPGLLDWTEALRGSPEKGSTGICYNTSAGYLYSKGKRGKTDYLVKNDDGTYDYEPQFFKTLVEFDDQLQKGNQIEVIWADFLKDECRTHEKVNAGKTRLVSGCQIHYLFLMRRYFQDFITHTNLTCVNKPVATGINPHSNDWSQLYMRLSRTSDTVIAGDFSNFDGKLPKYIGEFVINFINYWYDDGKVNARARFLLAEHIYNATHIVYDKVYQVVDGNPSGNPITTLYNSLCNIVMCNIILREDFKIPDGNYNLTVYGDDNIITVKDVKLRASDLTPHFKRRFDLDYTHFSKKENEDYDTLSTISYLGRKFSRVDSVIKAPLELDTILQSVYWIYGAQDHNSVMIDTCRSFLLELSHHGRDIYDEYSTKLLEITKLKMPRVYEAVNFIMAEKSYYAYHDSMFLGGVGEYFAPTVNVDGPTRSLQVVLESRDLKPNEDYFPEEVKQTDGSHLDDRHINIVAPTQGVELGAYLDASDVTPSATDPSLIQNIHRECNMELFHLDSVLKREYQVGVYAWDGTQAANTQLGIIYHPNTLLTIPYVQEKINDFAYMRAGMRLSVRVVCNKFCYGKIGVFFKPNPWTDTKTALERINLFTHSGDPHILVSASAGETAIFDVPFIFPRRAYNISTDSDYRIGDFIVKVFNPLISCTEEVPSAKVFITAQFLDLELFLPSSLFLESKSEAIVKSKTHTISTVLEKTDTVLSAVSTMPFIGTAASALRCFTRPAATIAKATGMFKPTTEAATDITTINPFLGMAGAHGVDFSVKHSTKPDCALSAGPRAGVTKDEMPLVVLAGTPMLYEQIALQDGDFYPMSVFNVSNTPGRMGFFDFIANNFTGYSGSMKLKFYFTASIMQSATIVIYLSRDLSDDWMNCYHQVVNVTGDTEFEATFPYPENQYAISTTSNVDFQVGVQVIAWSQPDPSVNNPIYMNVYRAAADDVVFYGHKESIYTFYTESNPRVDFEKPFTPLHPSFTSYRQDGIVYGESVTHMKDLLLKYYPYLAKTDAAVNPAYYLESYSALYTGGIEMICMPYNFWCGSMRHKYVPKNNDTMCLNMTYTNSSSANYIGTSISSTVNPLVDIEIPYYRYVAYQGTKNTTQNGPFVWCYGSPCFLFKSAGDDFSLHFIGAFPAGTFNTAPADAGYQALRTFINS